MTTATEQQTNPKATDKANAGKPSAPPKVRTSADLRADVESKSNQLAALERENAMAVATGQNVSNADTIYRLKAEISAMEIALPAVVQQEANERERQHAIQSLTVYARYCRFNAEWLRRKKPVVEFKRKYDLAVAHFAPLAGNEPVAGAGSKHTLDGQCLDIQGKYPDLPAPEPMDGPNNDGGYDYAAMGPAAAAYELKAQIYEKAAAGEIDLDDLADELARATER